MRSNLILGLPSSLLLLLAAQAEGQQPQRRSPTAIRKMPLDSSEKLFPEHLAFADNLPDEENIHNPFLSPREAVLAARLQLTAEEEGQLNSNSSTPGPQRQFRPAFKSHGQDDTLGDDGWWYHRRARDTLHLLEGRQGCPGGFQDCSDVGHPNKCCMTSEVCVEVDDSSVGGVACCPEGAECGGSVGSCPGEATTCDQELGGGCCIEGYICEGVGCVPSPPPAPSTTSTTSPPVTTVTSTSTTTASGGEPSTVVVTIIITASSEPETITSTKTSTVTPSASTTTRESESGGRPPFRPTSSEASTTEAPTESGDICPTGFYGCLAREGGGCCRTGRDCGTSDCPSTPMTTITTHGATIVVPASDVPGSSNNDDECANGWYLCGSDAGPVAGCCPSGYECGTASCTATIASQTAEIQKQLPDSGASALGSGVVWQGVALFVAGAVGFGMQMP